MKGNMPEMQKVLYVSRNDGTDTRMSKEVRTLIKNNYNVVFLGWDRKPEEKKPDPILGVRKLIYKKKSGFRSLSMLPHLLGYYFFLVKGMVSERPDIVHVVNEDLLLAVLPFKKALKFRLVLDIYDSFRMRYTSVPLFLKQVMHCLTSIAFRYSDAILVTDNERQKYLELDKGKTWVVGNYPEDPGVIAPLDKYADRQRLYLYVSGTLYSSRGLEQITKLMDFYPFLYVISAGWVQDQVAREFVNHEKVEFLGTLTPDVSLQYAASCDAVVALYKPENDNMLFASPNKVYDAMCVGRPVIINSEVGLSRWVEKENLGYIFEYENVEALKVIIQSVLHHKVNNSSLRKHIRSVFDKGYSWGSAEKKLLNAYNKLSYVAESGISNK